ncbi:TonB-dependent siderophore receptor [Calothrix parasitica NIES-267]|uniref:TonB-dependent siderophore receptor n=1 Tax=Calothrix parasitica NIES-267 TaxID=1973488 RepID=A0A1Z4LYC0_9CYAN|nr:TonB-dependent siderophore receptor [Calothrix parasitica NIES-267]
MQRWCLSVSVRLWILISFSGYLSIITVLPGFAKEKSNYQNNKARLITSLRNRQQKSAKIPQISEIEFPSKSARMLVQTPNNSSNKTEQNSKTISITGVKANPTEKGLEIILQTTQARQLQVINRSSDNNFIADIPNAQLKLTSGDTFKFNSEKPLEGITEITVINLNANTVRITATGETALPKVELFDSGQGLIFGLAPTTSTAQKPQNKPEERQQSVTEAPSKKPTQQDETIELFVTGERDGYVVPNATTATRTDTPLKDIPQSIQVVPKQILEDRSATELRDALETVGGISSAGGRGTGSFGETFKIRGFDINGNALLRDGIPFFSQGTLGTNDIERLEVLKGPASVLFGSGEPGGVINLVSKQPLFEPKYSTSFTVGSFDNYQGAIDLSAPLNDSKTVRYRLNVDYENYGSFRDFVDGERFSISPTITWDISPNTSLNLYGQYTNERETLDDGLPETSDGVVDIPRSRFLNEDFGEFEQDQFNIGYTLNHRFNEDWSVRHALQYLEYDALKLYPFFDTFDEVTGELSRIEYVADESYQRFFTNVEGIGKFNTGSIKHQIVAGVEYRRNTEDPSFQFSNTYPSINVFNPVYTRTPYEIAPEFFRDDRITGIGIYLQDQIDLLPNLKVLAGVRYDNFDQFRTTQNLGEERQEFEQTDSAWSPRFGIVYQPIEPLSLYASYTRSFSPSFGANRNNGQPFEPETGRQFEVGAKADLSDKLSLTLAAFDIRKQNVSTTDPDNIAFSIQTGEQTSRGIELNLAGEVSPGLKMTASYTYLDAFVSKDTDFEGNRLPDVPENQFSLWTTYEIQKGNLAGLGFGLGLYYVGERQRDLDNSYELPSYFRTDAALFYKRNNWRAQLNIENLFDIDYFRSANYSFVGGGVNPGKPFAVTASFAIDF